MGALVEKLQGEGFRFVERMVGDVVVVRVWKGRRLVGDTGSWVREVAWSNAVSDELFNV